MKKIIAGIIAALIMTTCCASYCFAEDNISVKAVESEDEVGNSSVDADKVGTSAELGNSGFNPGTGVTLVFIPVAIAAVALVVSIVIGKKKKK